MNGEQTREMEQPQAVGELDNVLRVGLVGAGVVGSVHRAIYDQHPSAEVVALADPRGLDVLEVDGAAYVPGARASASRGLPVYDSLAELLDSEEVDLIDICAPTNTHLDLTIEALEADKHVLCEKPMGRTVADCRTILAAVANSDRKYMVAHCLRFWPVYEYLREIVNSGQYGDVELAKFSRQVVVPPAGWFLDGKVSGGAILDLHIHDVDTAAWIFGAPASLTAFGRIGPSGCHDQVMAHWHYDDDRLVMLEASWLKAARAPFSMGFEIEMEGATITLDSLRDPPLQVHIPGDESQAPELSSQDGYYYEIDYFLRAIINDSPIERVTPESSLATVALIETEIESIESGQTVEFDLT